MEQKLDVGLFLVRIAFLMKLWPLLSEDKIILRALHDNFLRTIQSNAMMVLDLYSNWCIFLWAFSYTWMYKHFEHLYFSHSSSIMYTNNSYSGVYQCYMSRAYSLKMWNTTEELWPLLKILPNTCQGKYHMIQPTLSVFDVCLISIEVHEPENWLKVKEMHHWQGLSQLCCTCRYHRKSKLDGFALHRPAKKMVM